MRFRLTLESLGLVLAGGMLVVLVQSEAPASTPASTPDAGDVASRLLTGTVLHQSDDLAMPMELEVTGDRLVIADDYADHAIRVVRREDGSLERTFGTRGRGPREFEAVSAIDAIDSSGRILLHDPTLQRITRVDLTRDFEDGEWVADRSVPLHGDGLLFAAEWTPDGLVGVGTFVDGRVAHLSPDGEVVRTTGALPVRPAEVTRAVWMQTRQTRLQSNPSRTRFAVASRFADRLEIYDRSGALLALADRPYDFDPEDIRSDDPDAVRFGYIALTATDERIYALFSGRTRGEGLAYTGDRIHVFDWDGVLRDVWQVDSRLVAVATAPEGDALYGIRHDPLPAVVRYAMN